MPRGYRVGLPAVARAHCDYPGGGDSPMAVVAFVQDTVVAKSAGELSAPTRSDHFYETSQLPAQKKLLYGIVYLSGDVALRILRWQFDVVRKQSFALPKPYATLIANFEDQVLKHLDPAFSLERPPRD